MREFAIGLDIELPPEQDYPTADQIRRALQKKLDDLGDLEIVEAVWEVYE
jgi:hypothetical protein